MNNKVMIAIGAALGLGGGVGIGLLLRQPEINKLHKQVKMLQGDVGRLQSVIEEQNQEIAQLIVEYKAVSVIHFFQRSAMKEEIEDILLDQYAAADYLHLLLDCVNGDYIMEPDDVRFYKSFGRMLSNEPIDYDDEEFVKEYVRMRHSGQIRRLELCDTESVLEEIRAYDKNDSDHRKKGLRLPWKKGKE